MQPDQADALVSLSGGQVLVMIVVLSFAIDRIVTALLMLLSFVPWWRERFPVPEQLTEIVARARAGDLRKLLYVGFCLLLALIVVLAWQKIRFFEALGYPIPPLPDVIFTVIVLAGGSDLLSRAFQLAGVGGLAPRDQGPVEIEGRIRIEHAEPDV